MILTNLPIYCILAAVKERGRTLLATLNLSRHRPSLALISTAPRIPEKGATGSGRTPVALKNTVETQNPSSLRRLTLTETCGYEP